MGLKYEQPLESIVLNVACTIGTIRMVIALYFDFTKGSFLNDILLDGALFALFVIPLTLSRAPINFNLIAVPFCVILGVLASINWLSTGGYEGTAEYNMIALFFLYALVFKGSLLFLFVGLLILDQILLVYIWIDRQDIVMMLNDSAPIPQESLHFVIVVMAVSISMVYLKNRFDDKRLDLQDKSLELGERSYELDYQNQLLMNKKYELEQINSILEIKVAERSSELKAQNKAIEQYFEVSLSDINAPLRHTHDAIYKLKFKHDQNPLVQLLIQSATELSESVKGLSLIHI